MDEAPKGGAAENRGAAEARVEEAIVLFQSITETLHAMLAEVRGGNVGSLRKLPDKQSELETALRRCQEVEKRFNEKYGSGAERSGGEIDFDKVRRDIGCRLARLRTCCGAGELSGEPDA